MVRVGASSNLFSVRVDDLDVGVDALMDRFYALPRYVAKKHLQAAMKRALKDGVPILRAKTPKRSGKVLVKSAVERDGRGRFQKGSGKLRNAAGDMRRSVIAKSKYVGKSSGGYVVGALGYKVPWNSRKAIWLTFGTKSGIDPRTFVEEAMKEMEPKVAGLLAAEMANALEKAAAELASGKNPGVGRSGFGPGRK
jgi:hypothetical protein